MSNTLTALVPRILAQGLLALRGATVMPRLVNRGYEALAGQRGSTVDVPIPSAITAQAVSAAATPPSTADITPISVAIPLDQWYEAPFYLTDQDKLQIMDGIMPMQGSEAIKALAQNMNLYIFNLYKKVYGYEGAAGTTPFVSTLAEAIAARKRLNLQLAPMNDRRLVLDSTAEANALGLAQFTNMQYSGSNEGLIEGSMGRKLGFDWFADQQVVTHTSTPFTAGAVTVAASQAVGVGSTDGGRTGTLSIAKITNASPLVAGDIFTIAGDTQTYVVLTAVSLIVGTTSVAISPALKVACAGTEVITLKASHVVNLAFHRDAFAFATRPLEATADGGLGNLIQSASDPISGLTLRLEVSREHKRTRYSFDVLYGGAMVRPELACRLAG